MEKCYSAYRYPLLDCTLESCYWSASEALKADHSLPESLYTESILCLILYEFKQVTFLTTRTSTGVLQNYSIVNFRSHMAYIYRPEQLRCHFDPQKRSILRSPIYIFTRKQKETVLNNFVVYLSYYGTQTRYVNIYRLRNILTQSDCFDLQFQALFMMVFAPARHLCLLASRGAGLFIWAKKVSIPLSVKVSIPLSVGANCADLFESGVGNDGVYTIDPDGRGSFEVRCESGGWTVIQRRLDGSIDFFLDWSQYKSGFGDLNGEFWLGLDKIHRLTKSGLKKLRIDLMDFNNAQVYAQYTTFEISDEANRYTLNVAGYSGNAGDSLAYHNGHKFSTKDKDNTGNCATNRKGAWWYDACAWSNLNGQYLGPNQDQWHGIQWRFWKNTNECMKRADMKLRPQS
ncbi:Hypothetical predicted protein [Paramuricea clavata]|uniref:Uncharacterized protein n=1 Tax=Paramuricea clavata TaxID=317549 RepID=A0A6S7IAQ9_PARCT|nr:Hypothetical predicted protein [Paramuricea clavata]